MANKTLGVIDNGGNARSLSGVDDVLNSNAFAGARVVIDADDGYRQKVDSNGRASVSSESPRAHYQYSKADFAPVAAPTAMMIIQGSATKTVEIKRIRITGAATAAGSMRFLVTRRSTAGTTTSATLTPVTPAKRDTLNPSATAVVSTVSVANVDALGTTAGEIAGARLNLVAIGSAATSGEGQPTVLEFGTANDQPLRLRGTSDYITIEGAGSSLPSGAKLDINLETVEY